MFAAADFVDVIECQSEAVREMTVGDFFRIFQNADVRSGKIYKLKVSWCLRLVMQAVFVWESSSALISGLAIYQRFPISLPGSVQRFLRLATCPKFYSQRRSLEPLCACKRKISGFR